MQTGASTYSKAQLNAIATRALIDEDFKAAVLNGKRSKRIQEYPLSNVIKEEVMNIRATDVGQFIQGLYAIIDTSI